MRLKVFSASIAHVVLQDVILRELTRRIEVYVTDGTPVVCGARMLLWVILALEVRLVVAKLADVIPCRVAHVLSFYVL